MNNTGTRRRTALLVVLAMTLIGGAASAQTGLLAVAPADLKWEDGPPTLPPGTKIAVMHGDPAKAGPYALRLKFPANYKVMPHRHPIDEHVTVLSGTIYLGVGEKFEEKGKTLPAGSFWVMSAETSHFGWTTEETIVQLHGIGPTAITYVNPADDPRKK